MWSPYKGNSQQGSGTQGHKEMKMKEMRRERERERGKADDVNNRWWRFKKTKMGTSGQLSKAYIQLHADFKVQLEPYDI
jgi:hypothetical protein